MDSYDLTALYRVPVEKLFTMMTDGYISAQPSMLALLYADTLGRLGATGGPARSETPMA
ncbi:MAG: hypothetical protein ACYDGN_15950 [Acidimicrobiales bacterium]